MRWLLLVAIMAFPLFLEGQNLPVNGWCMVGGQPVLTQGQRSSTLVQASYPMCTVAVYVSGSTVLATIFSDQHGTPLTNPFTANTNGSWLFFIAPGMVVDATMSGGTPAFPAPVTLTSLIGGINAGGGGGTSGGAGGIQLINNNSNPSQTITGTNGTTVTSTAGTTTITSPTVMTRDLSDFGVKADGTPMSCTTVAGSIAMHCYGGTGYNPHFTTADVGKLILIPSAGSPTGRVAGPMTVVSGGTGGTPGMQGVTFTDASSGCNTVTTMPYAWVQVGANGVPTGTLTMHNFRGEGCTHPPTTGTVATVTGTVTFSGGTIPAGDLPTTIASVVDQFDITLADTPTAAYNGTIVYGTDDHDAFQTACNARYSGELTFSGIVMISHGITCNGAQFHLRGQGWKAITVPMDTSLSSNIVYAGKGNFPGAPIPDHIIELADSWQASIRNMGLRGNTVAKPYGIRPSFGRPGTTGGGISQQNIYDQLWIGWVQGDQIGSDGYQLQSCIFADTPLGNTDFATIDHTYCWTAEVGIDGNNAQSVGWRFGIFNAEYDNIGVATFGSQTYDDYYTEYNRLDIRWGGTITSGYGIWLNMNYGGESSAQSFYMGQGIGNINPWYISITGGLGYPLQDKTYASPVVPMVDLSYLQSTTYGAFTWDAALIPGKILMGNTCLGGVTLDLFNVFPFQLDWSLNPSTSPLCNNLIGGWLHLHNSGTSMWDFHQDLQLTGANTPPSTLQNDNFFQQTTGSILVKSPRPPGESDIPNAGNYLLAAVVAGTPGTTPYNYQITCSDGQGLETAVGFDPSHPVVPFTINVPNGNATLNSTNYNAVMFVAHRGCAYYNLYGDNGSAPMGFMKSLSQDNLTYPPVTPPSPNNWLSFNDQGQWPKNTSRVPPAASQSGTIDVEGGYKVHGQLRELNVRSFGAVCDGFADDTVALKAAFAAASKPPQACVYIPPNPTTYGGCTFNDTLAIGAGPGYTACIRGDNDSSRLFWTGNDATKAAITVDGERIELSSFSLGQAAATGHDWKAGIIYGNTWATQGDIRSVNIACGGYTNQNLGDGLWISAGAKGGGLSCGPSCQADMLTLDHDSVEFCSNGEGIVGLSGNAVSINIYNTTVFGNHIALDTGITSNFHVWGGEWDNHDLMVYSPGGGGLTIAGIRAETTRRYFWNWGSGLWPRPTTFMNNTIANLTGDPVPTTANSAAAGSGACFTQGNCSNITVPQPATLVPGIAAPTSGLVEGDAIVIFQDATHVFRTNVVAWANRGTTITISPASPYNLTNATVTGVQNCTVTTIPGTTNITLSAPCIDPVENQILPGAGVGGAAWNGYGFSYTSATTGTFPLASTDGNFTTTVTVRPASGIDYWGQCKICGSAAPVSFINNYFGGAGTTPDTQHFQIAASNFYNFEGNIFPDLAPNPFWMVGTQYLNLWQGSSWTRNLQNTGTTYTRMPDHVASVTSLLPASANHTTCFKSDGTIGYCSTAVDATGACTCN